MTLGGSLVEVMMRRGLLLRKSGIVWSRVQDAGRRSRGGNTHVVGGGVYGSHASCIRVHVWTGRGEEGRKWWAMATV